MAGGGEDGAAGARRDAVAGAILLLFGIAWTVTVYQTVPVGRFGVGPRAFPLYLGAALVVLSALLTLSGLLRMRRRSAGGAPAPEAGQPEDDAPPPTGLGPWQMARILGGVCGIIAVYGLLMQPAGFLLATALVVAGTLWFALGIRRPLLILGMSAGIAGGSWAGFGLLLGAYLPRGTWLFLF